MILSALYYYEKLIKFDLFTKLAIS